MLQLLVENYEVVVLIVGTCVGVYSLGRKRAISLILQLLNGSKEYTLNNIENNHKTYTDYVYSKLPKSARMFVSKKNIDKIILGFIKEAKDTDLDKK